jgi:hypothetical protein
MEEKKSQALIPTVLIKFANILNLTLDLMRLKLINEIERETKEGENLTKQS